MNKDNIVQAFKIIEQNAAVAKLDLVERMQSQEALKAVWAFIGQAAIPVPEPAKTEAPVIPING